MSSQTIQISAISNLALEVVKRIIEVNEKTNEFSKENMDPLELAAAMDEFFQMASALETGEGRLDGGNITDLADYALDLVDRLAYLVRQLDVFDQTDNLANLYITLSVWFARQEAEVGNLSAIADSFALLINKETKEEELANYAQMIDELLEAAPATITNDFDKSNPWRPWRVLNLNAGVAATRSLKTDLMVTIFDKLVARLPQDVAGFFADGKRQMDAQDVPDEVRDTMTQYSNRHPDIPLNLN